MVDKKQSGLLEALTNINEIDANSALGMSTVLAALLWTSTPKQYLKFPISSTLNGLLYGSLCAFGVKIVAKELPPRGKLVFGGLLLASGLYSLVKGAIDDFQNKDKDVKPLPFIVRYQFLPY